MAKTPKKPESEIIPEAAPGLPQEAAAPPEATDAVPDAVPAVLEAPEGAPEASEPPPDLGPPAEAPSLALLPEPARHYRVTKGGRVYMDGFHELRVGTIVSSVTHDLEVLGRQGIEAEACDAPGPVDRED